MSSFSNRQRRLRVGATLSLVLLGCAPPSSTARPAPQRPSNEIAKSEIEAQGLRFVSAYDIVRALRPTMLASKGFARGTQSRSATWESSPAIKVYLDGFRWGGVESLATIPAANVQEVRWLSAIDATIRFGTGNVAGAIVVTSRTGVR